MFLQCCRAEQVALWRSSERWQGALQIRFEIAAYAMTVPLQSAQARWYRGTRRLNRPLRLKNRDMPNDAPPLILTFGPADPTGATGVQADILTFASMGGYGVSVLTGYTLQDSRTCDDVVAVDAELIADQARMLLEDMPIAAFKVGGTIRAENASAIAEVVSDYDDMPLILAPDFTLPGEHLLSADELREATATLLAPQTTVLVASHASILLLAQPFLDADNAPLDEAIGVLLEHGCEYVLVTDSGTQQVINTLHGETGLVRQDTWERMPYPVAGATDTLAAAITALLASGLEPPAAVREAQEYLQQVMLNAFRPGMGRYFPDRFFWARGDESEADEAGESGEPASS